MISVRIFIFEWYLAYQTLATLFSVKKIQKHKNNTERVQKNEAMSILHTKVDPSEKDVECRLQLYKQEMCDFLYKASAMVFIESTPAHFLLIMQGTSSKNKSDICKPVQTEDDKELPIFYSEDLNGLHFCCGKWLHMEINIQSCSYKN